MKSVFVISHGDYSDYRINRVFSTKELADDYVTKEKILNDIDYDIEEFPLDEPKVGVLNHLYVSQIGVKDGKINHLQTRFEWSDYRDNPEMQIRELLEGPENLKFCFVRTSTVSQEGADKLCIETRQRYLAEKEQL